MATLKSIEDPHKFFDQKYKNGVKFLLLFPTVNLWNMSPPVCLVHLGFELRGNIHADI